MQHTRYKLDTTFEGFPKNFGILSSEACFLLFLGFTREKSQILGSTSKSSGEYIVSIVAATYSQPIFLTIIITNIHHHIIAILDVNYLRPPILILLAEQGLS